MCPSRAPENHRQPWSPRFRSSRCVAIRTTLSAANGMPRFCASSMPGGGGAGLDEPTRRNARSRSDVGGRFQWAEIRTEHPVREAEGPGDIASGGRSGFDPLGTQRETHKPPSGPRSVLKPGM